ncbi:MAG TPA: paraquat-inducible protein A [Burkholderiaceae bacterium]|nr:paraquat-inducible protein A [Burkholderiaceae bacterium]
MTDPTDEALAAPVRPDLMACPECDLLLAAPAPHAVDGASAHGARPGRHLVCVRCRAPLGVSRHRTFDKPAAFALASFVALAIAHLEPVLVIELQGRERSATLWEAAWTLYDEGAWLVTLLVLLTTLVNPLVETLAICWVLLPLRRGRLAPGFDIVLRALVAVRPWVMVEVFMLGVLVAFVKLSSLAIVLPGAGLWAFAATMLLMTATAWTFDDEHVWASTARLRQAEAEAEAGDSARADAGAAGARPATSASSE